MKCYEMFVLPHVKNDCKTSHTVDGSEILHQLRLVVYPTIYRVVYIPGGA